MISSVGRGRRVLPTYRDNRYRSERLWELGGEEEGKMERWRGRGRSLRNITSGSGLGLFFDTLGLEEKKRIVCVRGWVGEGMDVGK